MRFRQIWSSSAFHWIFQAGFGALCLYWWRRLPAPGKAVLALTVVAVVMTLIEMRPWHKAGWLLIVFCMMYLESRAIDKDRRDFASEQAAIRNEEQQQFRNIVHNLELVTQQNQNNFDATMQRSDRIMTLGKSSLSGISESMKTITGGDSFCYISIGANSGESIAGVSVTHSGRYPLHSVAAAIDNWQISANMDAKHERHWLTDRGRSAWPIGELSSKGTVYLGTLPYQLTGDKQDFSIFFNAQNGFWSELLHMRRVNGNWVTVYQVIGGPKGSRVLYQSPIPKEYPGQPRCLNPKKSKENCVWAE